MALQDAGVDVDRAPTDTDFRTYNQVVLWLYFCTSLLLEEQVDGFTYFSNYFSNFSSVTQHMQYIFGGGSIL